jgi:hypothetical protein
MRSSQANRGTTTRPDEVVAGVGEKRPYTAPRLVEYGSVSKLTQMNGGSGADGGPVGMRMEMCL